MDTREFFRIVFQPFWKWIVGGLMSVIGFAVFLYPNWQPYLTWPEISQLLPWYWWVIIGAIVWGLETAWEAAKKVGAIKGKRAIVSLNGTASSYHDLALVWLTPSMYDSNTKPTLVLRGSMPIRRYNLKKDDSIIPHTEFLHVEFLNNRMRETGVPYAYKIRAWVTFFSAQTKRITHDFPGRWEGNEPEYDEISTWEGVEKYKDLLEVDIPSDGFTKLRLNIAVRFDNASFAFNNDWYKIVRAEVFALPEKQYYVRVQLGGENMAPSEYWLELINGENETTLIPLEKPVKIGKEIFEQNIEKTFTTREDFLQIFEKAMQKPSKRKRKKDRG